ncbi:MAG: YndJ family transporter [Saprospiraceae bacterium]|nr:YndJ family transporter [Saprospiraceae bacterium]
MKISFFLPGAAALQDFLTKEKVRPFTYTAVGHTRDAAIRVPGFDHDAQRVAVGRGDADFERAKLALRSWVHFPASWTRILPAAAPIGEGDTIAMLFRMFGLWWHNSCRIVYVIDEPDRFGFAYGTLPAHIERGEEIFLVTQSPDGTVWYELRAFSRPRALLARLGYPVVRLLQEKFRQDSAAAVRAFVGRPLGRPAEPFFTPDGWIFRLLLTILSFVLLWPGSVMGHDYGNLPLAAAFLAVTPAVLLLAARHYPGLRPAFRPLWPGLLPAGLLATLALAWPVGWEASLLTLPWMAICVGVAGIGLRFLWQNRLEAGHTALGAGLLFLAVGGISAFAERAGLSIFGFGADLIRLTALHFHFAGLAFTVLIALNTRVFPGRWSRLTAWAVVLGVPVTAIGITATQLQWGPFTETFAAAWMALSALSGGLIWTVTGARRRNGWLVAAGLVLAASMVLALGYGLRVLWPEWALSLDWMRALHGSLNGLVAVPLALLGFWWLGVDSTRV